jgi:hypothetical protein
VKHVPELLLHPLAYDKTMSTKTKVAVALAAVALVYVVVVRD